MFYISNIEMVALRVEIALLSDFDGCLYEGFILKFWMNIVHGNFYRGLDDVDNCTQCVRNGPKKCAVKEKSFVLERKFIIQQQKGGY